MSKQKVVQTVFAGKMKRLVRRGWVLVSKTQGFLQPPVYTLMKPAKKKGED